MRRRRRNKRNTKIFVGITLCLLLVMTIGYAAFQTNLNITAKGNIKDYNAAWQLEKNIVSSGDGLYIDTYENNRYIYRVQNPNNYIEFNGELWRIIAIEPDDTLKIIKKESIGVIPWDTNSSENGRNNSNNTYCQISSGYYNGCNAWAAVSGNFINGNYSGTVTQDASLNTYLNNDYYNSLGEDKEYIISHIFYTGPTAGNDSPINEEYELEKSRTWNGKIGLMNTTDFLKASTNSNCITISLSRSASAPCTLENGNYLDENKYETWTINSYGGTNITYPTSGIRTVSAYFTHETDGLIQGGVSGSYAISSSYLVRPVVFLKSNIKLMGDGTESNPYKII